MAAIDLLSATGDPVIDAIIRGIVGRFETSFPDRIRAYYLIGSYADGTAVGTSDIDLKIIFKDSLAAGAEEQAVQQLVQECARESPVDLDVVSFGEDAALAVGDVDIKLASTLLYDDDIRERMPLLPIEVWARALLHGLLRFMMRARGNPLCLTFPLDYPDPAGEFYGYDRRRLRSRDGGMHNTTKDLVRIVGGAASALVGWRTGRYVARKSECVAAYRESINDEWTDLVAAVDEVCRVEFGYRVPADGESRRRLRALCERALRFENHFLGQYRAFALHELTQPPADDRWVPAMAVPYMLGWTPAQVREAVTRGHLRSVMCEGHLLVAAGPCYQAWAAQMLGQVIYPGDEAIEVALATHAASDFAAARHAAQRSLRTIQTVTAESSGRK
jgi:hypothetical protein